MNDAQTAAEKIDFEYQKSVETGHAEPCVSELRDIIQLHAINPAVKELERVLEENPIIGMSLDCMAGKLTTFNSICGYVSQLELEKIELKQQLAESESARARAVEALKKWYRNTGGQCIECNQGGVHVPFIDHDDDCSIGLALNPTLTKEVM